MDDQTDKLIAISINRAILACFEIASELMFMRTVTSQTADGRNRLRDGLYEIVDMNKAMIHELRKINDLIEFGG